MFYLPSKKSHTKRFTISSSSSPDARISFSYSHTMPCRSSFILSPLDTSSEQINIYNFKRIRSRAIHIQHAHRQVFGWWSPLLLQIVTCNKHQKLFFMESTPSFMLIIIYIQSKCCTLKFYRENFVPGSISGLELDME